MQWAILKKAVIMPMFRRVGVLTSGWLIAQGLEADLVHQLTTAVLVAIGVVVDLTLSHFNRKSS